MKHSLLSLLTISTVILSGCGYDLVKRESVEIVPIPAPNRDVTLTDVRTIYKDTSVEIFDLNEYPGAYAEQRVVRAPQKPQNLNKNIPVRDRSVEIYDLGLAPVSSKPHQIHAARLSPPSNARDGFDSPFHVIEEDGLLTDPLVGESTQTSVIVPPAEDELELMTVF